ncbi:MAG: ParB N-terminal domain-containing protein [Acetobacteraceae bacterium]|nr:ParB N-terminal domain-containing protein [Acetobacteraceae bacterium]
MAELRSVDPRTLKLNPDNPRRTAIPKEMDAQLVASINAIGLLQPPVVREIGGKLVVRAGDRRTKAAISAGLKQIDVYVLDGDDAIDPMAAMSENLVRVSMNPVDTWRGVQRLESQGWNEEAIAGALALPPRAIRKLKLLPAPADAGRHGQGQHAERGAAAHHRQRPARRPGGGLEGAQAQEGPRRGLVGSGAGAQQAPHPVLGRALRCRHGRGIRGGVGGRFVRAGRRGRPLYHERRRLLRGPAGVHGSEPPEEWHRVDPDRIRPAQPAEGRRARLGQAGQGGRGRPLCRPAHGRHRDRRLPAAAAQEGVSEAGEGGRSGTHRTGCGRDGQRGGREDSAGRDPARASDDRRFPD